MEIAQTGYYRIRDDVALRSWPLIDYAYYTRDERDAHGLSGEEFDLITRCDGAHELPGSKLLGSLLRRGLIEPCPQGKAPCDWSRPKRYGNMYMPMVNFMITGRCNYNCLHCFNAADNAPLTSEWSFDEACELIAQARDCGVRAWLLTGGEPMAHRRFLDIVAEIHRNGMMVADINTNGHYITPELLSELRSMGCRPTMKISFDGVGFHDWMRQRKGAETRTLSAMRLCVEHRLDVMAQVNLNRRNRPSMETTLDVLEEAGVRRTRIIRTTEAPRWEKAAGDACMTFSEYYDECLSIARNYTSRNHEMELDFWQFLLILPTRREFAIEAIKNCGARGFRYTLSRCTSNRSMVAITSNGDVVPCMQMSGWMESRGMRLANVHETPLSEVLTRGRYLDAVRENLYEFCVCNKKCAACPHFRRCAGGCPALGLVFAGEARGLDGEDLSKCLFFNGSWEDEIVAALDGWKNLTPQRNESQERPAIRLQSDSAVYNCETNGAS